MLILLLVKENSIIKCMIVSQFVWLMYLWSMFKCHRIFRKSTVKTNLLWLYIFSFDGWWRPRPWLCTGGRGWGRRGWRPFPLRRPWSVKTNKYLYFSTPHILWINTWQGERFLKNQALAHGYFTLFYSLLISFGRWHIKYQNIWVQNICYTQFK